MLWEMFKFHQRSAYDSPDEPVPNIDVTAALEEDDIQTNKTTSNIVEKKSDEDDLFINTLWGIHNELDELRESF
ncbi:unnamed protein product [Acanthoscelides obtectus]|uniref:Uncharacterized protein n=1 Tax=Acanthoscelides obtectus TaxID=200917 RepID=A0A9P0K9C5_ACAOB|nr:unnamed protein product [Acanthoscelides obtectus]CAK1642992.1 hypothetical protein AOBTE_LOCUS13345 [Acanthoscelides obtectus]